MRRLSDLVDPEGQDVQVWRLTVTDEDGHTVQTPPENEAYWEDEDVPDGPFPAARTMREVASLLHEGWVIAEAEIDVEPLAERVETSEPPGVRGASFRFERSSDPEPAKRAREDKAHF